jgi:hypothetical protein
MLGNGEVSLLTLATVAGVGSNSIPWAVDNATIIHMGVIN